jgi:hypothetical protein
MTCFAVVDLSNLFHRARHGAMASPEERAGLALLIIFRSLRKLYREFAVDHFVFAIDRGSWRYAVYPGYKARRRLNQLAASPREQREHQQFLDTLNALQSYLSEATQCTVLAAQDVEGDDFVARWIARHPQDEHIIVSGDSDFVQLMAPNVCIFDAINQRVIGLPAIIDEHGRNLAFAISPKNGKLKVGEPDATFVPEPEWWRKALFIKLLRGDVGDSVFSAFPGVRYEGKRCSIRAAWEDRVEQSYDWNNLMFQTWDKLLESGDVRPVTVLDEFRANEQLIDLTKQPPFIVQRMDAAIDLAMRQPAKLQIGLGFLRFCAERGLPALAKEANDHVTYLNALYRTSTP